MPAPTTRWAHAHPLNRPADPRLSALGLLAFGVWAGAEGLGVLPRSALSFALVSNLVRVDGGHPSSGAPLPNLGIWGGSDPLRVSEGHCCLPPLSRLVPGGTFLASDPWRRLDLIAGGVSSEPRAL